MPVRAGFFSPGLCYYYYYCVLHTIQNDFSRTHLPVRTFHHRILYLCAAPQVTTVSLTDITTGCLPFFLARTACRRARTCLLLPLSFIYVSLPITFPFRSTLFACLLPDKPHHTETFLKPIPSPHDPSI